MRRALAAPLCLAVVVAACGDRTGLLVDDEERAIGDDASMSEPPLDAAPADARSILRDASIDALPGIDASTHDAASNSDCPDAGATLIYLLSQESGLYSFYPPTSAFRFIGNVACPGATGTPWSMAVTRKGLAYAVFQDGRLYRVSTATAACEPTPFMPGQSGFTTFGMGYVADTSDPGETLFVADSTFTHDSIGLATVDTTSFKLNFVGPFSPRIPRGELTGTGDGRLFVYTTNASTSGSRILEVDKTSAKIIAANALAAGDPASAFAFAYWGGDFWVFTSPGGNTEVTRYRPSDGTETPIGTLAATIVGAGVSTCAPTP